ncbi:hypothetical protein A2G06_16495 (plasmid) [Geobacter anodireducens]|nr:hypothetical protein A2G06_16495 [Geobacter anodireducens]
MADNKNQVANAAKKGNGNGKGHQDNDKPRESFKDRKLRLAADKDYNVISQRTTDNAEYINLLNATDYLMYRLRMVNFDRHPTLTIDDLARFLKRNNEIREDINQFNIELAKAVGQNYTPPRGYTAKPLEQSKADTKQPESSPQEMPAATA